MEISKPMYLSLKIKNLLLICLIYLGLSGRNYAQNGNSCPDFKTGADQPELYLPLLKNKKVGVVTNQTGLVLKSQKHHPTIIDTLSIVDFLRENTIDIRRVFAPEHGFRGEADAGEYVKNGVDTKTGIPIISLYGKNKKPTAEQVKDLDIILFDIQDVGVRFYTYISTLAYVMEAAAEHNVEVIVLDRPNPHDGYTDGPILKEKWTSFVGMHPVPVVYGLTIGEYGNMVNGEGWLKNKIKAKYTLIPMKNYHKKQRYPILRRPSPNLPNDKSINLYPSLCFFEGAEVSVGRGTDYPFQIYGSPWTKKLDYKFTPKPNFGAKNPPFNGQLCYGENLSEYPKDLRELNLEWVITAYKNYKNPNKPFFIKNLWFDTLAGTDQLRFQIIQGKSETEIKKSWQKDLQEFEKIRQKYIIYKD
ncbi:exo-beta-N-acetylmuramidase NamZ family protein [Riemerella anatipestifer]|uniref:exo-beta-N-acetylmuramidase NamZ family protein n=1 Tax=Riemerella anatipestifer TaxID=34085 RepID=UPI003DA9F45F